MNNFESQGHFQLTPDEFSLLYSYLLNHPGESFFCTRGSHLPGIIVFRLILDPQGKVLSFEIVDDDDTRRLFLLGLLSHPPSDFSLPFCLDHSLPFCISYRKDRLVRVTTLSRPGRAHFFSPLGRN